jgi:hypothetical protein
MLIVFVFLPIQSSFNLKNWLDLSVGRLCPIPPAILRTRIHILVLIMISTSDPAVAQFGTNIVRQRARTQEALSQVLQHGSEVVEEGFIAARTETA